MKRSRRSLVLTDAPAHRGVPPENSAKICYELVFKSAIENKGEREILRQDNKELRDTLDKLTRS